MLNKRPIQQEEDTVINLCAPIKLIKPKCTELKGKTEISTNL